MFIVILGNKPVTSKKEFGKLDSFLHIQYFKLINVEQIFTLFWFLLQFTDDDEDNDKERLPSI